MQAHPASPFARLEQLRARVRRVLGENRVMGILVGPRGWDIDVVAFCGLFGFEVLLIDSTPDSPARRVLWFPLAMPVTDELIHAAYGEAWRVCQEWEADGKVPACARVQHLTEI